eukprot:6203873-Pleurochrysis_carterae.AAC.3
MNPKLPGRALLCLLTVPKSQVPCLQDLASLALRIVGTNESHELMPARGLGRHTEQCFMPMLSGACSVLVTLLPNIFSFMSRTRYDITGKLERSKRQTNKSRAPHIRLLHSQKLVTDSAKEQNLDFKEALQPRTSRSTAPFKKASGATMNRERTGIGSVQFPAELCKLMPQRQLEPHAQVTALESDARAPRNGALSQARAIMKKGMHKIGSREVQ